MTPRRGPDVTGADGVVLGTSVLGPPHGPTVVLQHGVGSSRTYLLEAVAPPLVTAGWTVVAAAVRGHAGATPVRDPDGHRMALLAADAAALVTATGAVACGGVSIGGHAAVAAVARGLVDPPHRVVAALPAWTGQSWPGEGPHAGVAVEVAAHGAAGMRARVTNDRSLRPWLRHVLVRDLAAHDEASLAAALTALDGGEAPSVEDLGRLPAGCLGVVGWPDDPGHPLAIAREWAAVAPGARMAVTTLDAPDVDPHALGRAVLDVLGSSAAR